MFNLNFQLRSVVVFCFSLIISALAILTAITPAKAAAATIVTGSVLYPDGSGVNGYTVDLTNTSGTTLASTTTNTAGVYSLSYDSASVLNQQLIVYLNDDAPAGYINPDFDSYYFTYTGSTQTAATFTLTQETKFIAVTVIDDQGSAQTLDVTATPLRQAIGADTTEHVVGSGTFAVEGNGKYLVTGDCNLSETADTCPYINVTGGQVIEFTEAVDVVETIAITIKVVFAPITVTGQFLDKDGNNIYSGSGFQPDITFTGYNKDYGVVTTRRKVNSSGIAEVKLLPGTWTILPSTGELGTAYETQTFYPADATFVISQEDSGDKPGEYDFGSVQAKANVASISGSLTVGTNHPAAINIVATNTTTGLRYSGISDSSGNFSIINLPYGDYAITIESTSYIPVATAYATVSETTPTVTGADIELTEADVTISGSISDGDKTVTNLPAAIEAEADNGATYIAPVEADGSYEIHLSSEQVVTDNVELKLLTQPSSDVYLTETQTVDITPNSTVSQDLVVSTTEVTISGDFVNSQGDAITAENLGDGAKVMAINLATSSVEEAIVDDSGNWEMEVGTGEWQIIPQVTDPAATVLTNDTSSKTVTVTDSASLTNIDLKVQSTVGTVTGSVTDDNGEPLAEVPILFTNLPALQATAAQTGQTVDQSEVVQVSTTTEADGSYTKALPAGEYTEYFLSNPTVMDLIEAPTESFTMKADKAVAVDATYTTADKSITGTVQGDLKAASVVAYSETRGMQELTVDDSTNTYSGELTKGDWTILASGEKNGKLFISEDAITINQAETTLNVEPISTKVEIPATVAATGENSEPIVLSNTAGAKVSIPAYATGASGDVTVELVPEPEVVIVGGFKQVGIAYDVNVVDSASDRVITQLDRPITLSLPIDNEITGSASADELNAAFYDPELKSYFSDGLTAKTDGKDLLLTSTHLTRFAATTITNALDALPHKPQNLAVKKKTATSVRLTWHNKPADGVITYYYLQTRKYNAKAKKKWGKYQHVTKEQKNIQDLLPARRYQFRVKACNATGCSDYTKWNHFKTKAE